MGKGVGLRTLYGKTMNDDHSIRQKKKVSFHGNEQKVGMMKSSLMFSQHWRISLMVALISISSIAVFAYIGSRLDVVFGTHPAFLIVGVIISFPISQFVVYRWIKEKYIPQMKKFSS